MEEEKGIEKTAKKANFDYQKKKKKKFQIIIYQSTSSSSSVK